MKLTFVSSADPSVEICIHKRNVTFKNTPEVQIKNGTLDITALNTCKGKQKSPHVRPIFSSLWSWKTKFSLICFSGGVGLLSQCVFIDNFLSTK